MTRVEWRWARFDKRDRKVVLLDDYDALQSRLERAEELLRATRDRVKFDANSDGGHVAAIDAFISMEVR